MAAAYTPSRRHCRRHLRRRHSLATRQQGKTLIAPLAFARLFFFSSAAMTRKLPDGANARCRKIFFAVARPDSRCRRRPPTQIFSRSVPRPTDRPTDKCACAACAVATRRTIRKPGPAWARVMAAAAAAAGRTTATSRFRLRDRPLRHCRIFRRLPQTTGRRHHHHHHHHHRRWASPKFSASRRCSPRTFCRTSTRTRTVPSRPAVACFATPPTRRPRRNPRSSRWPT